MPMNHTLQCKLEYQTGTVVEAGNFFCVRGDKEIRRGKLARYHRAAIVMGPFSGAGGQPLATRLQNDLRLGYAERRVPHAL